MLGDPSVNSLLFQRRQISFTPRLRVRATLERSDLIPFLLQLKELDRGSRRWPLSLEYLTQLIVA